MVAALSASTTVSMMTFTAVFGGSCIRPNQKGLHLFEAYLCLLQGSLHVQTLEQYGNHILSKRVERLQIAMPGGEVHSLLCFIPIVS